MMALTAPCPSIMETLPLETVHLIISFLLTEDLSNWRLASKECAKAGERHIVQEIHVMYTAKSFSNLLHISRHPSLSKYVQSIVYEVQYLEEVSQLEFEQSILDTDIFKSMTSGTKVALLKAWTAYERMLDEQLYIKKTGYDISTLTQALARFPLLKRIEVSSEFKFPSETLKRAYEDTMALMLEYDGRDDEGIGSRATGTALLAAAGMQSGLEDLHAHPVCWTLFSSAPLSLYVPVYANLRHVNLELVADFCGNTPRATIEERHVQLGRALRSATGLETLRLVLDVPKPSPLGVRTAHLRGVPIVWERITGDMTWSKLRSLELQVATCAESEIASFFTRHAATLRSVTLVNMWLTDCTGGWNSVFKVMKWSLKLEKVHLGGCWGQDDVKEGHYKLIKVYGEVGSRISKALMGLGDKFDDKDLSFKGAAGSDSPFIQFID